MPHLETSLFGSKNTSLLQEVAWVECQICLLDINVSFLYFSRRTWEERPWSSQWQCPVCRICQWRGDCYFQDTLFFQKVLEDSPFCRACFGLLVTSTLSFKTRVDPLVCVFHCLHVSSDSPLVWHLLTSWQPAWQPSCSQPLTYEQALVGHETRIYHACCCCSQCETWQMLYKLSYTGSAFFLKIFFEDSHQFLSNQYWNFVLWHHSSLLQNDIDSYVTWWC